MSEYKEIDISGVIPVENGSPKYDIRKLDKYCKDNNREAGMLTEEELKQFIVGVNVVLPKA